MIALTSRPTSVRPTALLALAAALALTVVALLPLPAQAHDTLIESDPVDGETLATSPEAITLTYSADVLEVSPVVRIADADGETVAEVTPTVDGPAVTAELEEPLPAGDYSVQWRVVSSDGHPIEGSFAFTVEQDTAGAAGPSDGGGAAPSDAGGGDESAASDAGGSDASDDGASEESAPAESEGGGSSMPLLLGIVGVAVLGVAIAAFFALRKRG
ncbi:copper resistance CopC family protein [Brachybacterium sacelli]|uniref:Methionine-rich copper-binding protein CopC n=1 Tax=Brachybacterium sacelli TaxID=173364 RepID=A0ABS4X3T0_9MICO|nr:methionine-rich copper-binding protein CopC [Brachybacterium sacelli]